MINNSSSSNSTYRSRISNLCRSECINEKVYCNLLLNVYYSCVP